MKGSFYALLSDKEAGEVRIAVICLSACALFVFIRVLYDISVFQAPVRILRVLCTHLALFRAGAADR